MSNSYVFNPYSTGRITPARRWAYLVMDRELMASLWCFCGDRLQVRGDRISSEGMVENFTHGCKPIPVSLELEDWNPNHIEGGA